MLILSSLFRENGDGAAQVPEILPRWERGTIRSMVEGA